MTQVPPCPHFPECGGCQLQQLDDAEYAAWIEGHVRGALGGQGLTAEVRPAYLSPPRTRRRAALKAVSTARGALIGFTQARTHQVVDMHACFVLTPTLFALVAPLRGLLSRLPKWRGLAVVTMTEAEQGIDLLLRSIDASRYDTQSALIEFAAEHRLARLAIDGGAGAEDLWVPDPVTVRLGSASVPLPHGAFLQATRDGEDALAAGVEKALTGAGRVTDLFAGLGTFALRLGERARYAAESDVSASAALEQASRRVSQPFRVERRDLYRRPLTAKELGAFDGVVLDPPRSGAQMQVAEMAGASLSRVAYVSCNPVSFARDAAALVAGGYRLAWVQPIGQFRWSRHVELVAGFTREG